MNVFSEKTLSALYAARWNEGREVDISIESQAILNEGYRVFPAVSDFLKQFVNLHIAFQSNVNPTIYIKLYFDVEESLRIARIEDFEFYGEDLNIQMCPIGIDNSGIVLEMSLDGKVYGIYPPQLLFIGNSGEEAIENYSNWHPSHPFPVIRDYSIDKD